MTVLLIGPDLEENLSLGYLAASLERAGYRADVQSYNGEADIDGVLENLPGTCIVGLSLTYQAKAREYLQLAVLIKKRAKETCIVAGGHYATCAAREILFHHPEIDLIVLHEGERTIVELAESNEHPDRDTRSIPGIAFHSNGGIHINNPLPKMEDLDSLPFPRRNKNPYLLSGLPTAYLLGSRGCLNSCAYCCISTIHRMAPGKRLRRREPGEIVREMTELYHRRGVRHFVFHDDNFLVPRLESNLARLCELERAIHRNDLEDISLTIKCSPSDVKPILFTKLREMGLLRVFLGIESSSDSVLHEMGRRQTRRQSERAIAICRSLGISVQFTIMVFNPFSDFNSMKDDVKFMKKYIDHPLNFCRTELFAGTPLERQMIMQRRAHGDYLGRVYSMPTPAMDRASRFFARLFYDRCWSQSSLMLMAGGMDHPGALLEHYYADNETNPLLERMRDFVTETNKDSVALLGEMIGLFEHEAELAEPDLVGRLGLLVERERRNREVLFGIGETIRDDLSSFVQERLGIERVEGIGYAIGNKSSNLARHALAALLALTGSGTTMCASFIGTGVEEYAPPPLQLKDSDGDGLYDRYEQFQFATNPDAPDTDGDGVPDGAEVYDTTGMTNWQFQLHKETPLISWILKGDLPRAHTLIVSGSADVNARDARGGTALMAAAEMGYPSIVGRLLGYGVDVNARMNDGSTALMKAAQGGNTVIVKMLLQLRADAALRDDQGYSALMLAENAAHFDVAEILNEPAAEKRRTHHR